MESIFYLNKQIKKSETFFFIEKKNFIFHLKIYFLQICKRQQTQDNEA